MKSVNGVFLSEHQIKRLEDGFIKKNRKVCWPWLKLKTKHGYGKINFHGIQVMAHRATYEFYRKRIPRGKVLDHLCGNPSCVNPWHLEAVSNKENLLRGSNNHPMLLVATTIVNTFCDRSK